jgi:hypothetical protein
MRFLLALMLQASAQSFGVEFQPPSGWQTVNAPPLRAFAPMLGAGELLLLAVFPPERLGSSDAFAAWFGSKLAAPGETILQESTLDRRAAHGHEALSKTQRVVIPGRGQMVRVAYAITDGKRVALAVLTSNQDQLINRHATVARTFFESMKFPHDAAASAPSGGSAPVATSAGFVSIPPASVEGNRPRGLFYRLQVAMGATRMETQVRVFVAGERVMRISPFGDGNAIDASRCSRDTCGSYSVDGEWVNVRWDHGDTERLRVTTAGELVLGSDTFRPGRAVRGEEVVGDWVNPGTGSVPLSTPLRFRADGTFEWGTGSETTLRGRYSLDGSTLTLAFTDGTSRKYALFAAGRTTPVGMISFDGTVYARR